MGPNDISIALVAYDEVDSLERVVREAQAVLRSIGDAGHEILIVDDGSRDGTGALADSLAARHPDIRVVHHTTNRGFSGAMLTAVRQARRTWIFLAPGDGQVPMSELERFVAAAAGADLVVGIRVQRHEGIRRRLLSKGFHLVARALLALPQREFSSAYLFRRGLLDGMVLRSTARSAALLPEILFRARRRGAVVRELTAAQRPRLAGRPKGGSAAVAVRTMLELLRLAVLLRIDERRYARSRRP